MRLGLGLVSLLSTAMVLSPAMAVDIQFFTNSGAAFWTINNASVDYCHYTSTACSSVCFYHLPAGAKGQSYRGTSDRCVQYVSETFQADQCLGSVDLHSANWFYSSKRFARREESLEPTRYSVTYKLPDSTSREIEVPVTDNIDDVLKLVEEKDYEALAKFPIFVKN